MAKAFVHAGTDKTLKMFGEAVRDLRKMQGLSQEAFADLIGVDRSYMGGIERGDPNVALINIQRTAVALDMKIGIKPIQGAVRRMRTPPCLTKTVVFLSFKKTAPLD